MSQKTFAPSQPAAPRSHILPAGHVGLGVLLAVLLIVAGAAAGLAAYAAAYRGQVYPGVHLGSINLSGLTLSQAKGRLRQAWQTTSSQGFSLVVAGKTITLPAVVSSTSDPDLSYELVRFDPEAAAASAFEAGRQGSWFMRFVGPLVAPWTFASQTPAGAEFDLDRIVRFIRDSLPGVEQAPKDADLTVDAAGNVVVQPESAGRLLDQSELRAVLSRQVFGLSPSAASVGMHEVTPQLTQLIVAPLLPKVDALMREEPLRFGFEAGVWTAEPEAWHQWLGVVLQAGMPVLTLSSQKASEFFGPIEHELNQPTQNAKFETKNGRVVVFQGSQPGHAVDVAATLAAAFDQLQKGESSPIHLVVAVTQPELTTADANQFGIAEVIGVGTSNFAGSPKNRRHNIAVGAATLNGIIIQPDENFSLLHALGTIDASAGYLQELVIKGNKTIPEFGGGLCQIGTTTFRTALASGLPILERRNHSYRVVYYEPAGTDATIYDPSPDFRFKNDTGHAILIQTHISGDTLTFEFWGMRDGRGVVQTKPHIYNITPPPEAKLVQTEDLPVGQKKCTEKAHNGADTDFTYTVTYPDGHKAEQVFHSHYIPWQEVCLVGVPKGTLQPTEPVAPEVLPTADAAGQAGLTN